MKTLSKIKQFVLQLIENYLISRWVEFYTPFRGGNSAGM